MILVSTNQSQHVIVTYTFSLLCIKVYIIYLKLFIRNVLYKIKLNVGRYLLYLNII